MRSAMHIACLVLCATLALPAAAQTVDPAKQTDILTLMDLTGSGRIPATTAESLRPRAQEWARRSNPQNPARAEQIIMENAHRVFGEHYAVSGGLRDRLVPVYDRLFSHDELRTIIAFYRSPTGARLLQALPAIQKETQTVGSTWGREVVPGFVLQANEALKAEGFRPMEAQPPQPAPQQ
ncbi:DUF2059 domain-containing protein [Uliginosibacterium sp. H1]|uniref:DUF2059 domain-containing protein n=1 Tax=Uliginosibacterium sp. H1 TaxID=3114757 RepID=UPI002E175101|nr:DUF2059 domain-containing protein [Uliginosibacterium sp. H1]